MLSLEPVALIGIRRRIAVELALVAVSTWLYLRLWPQRIPGVDVGLALVGLGLAAVLGRSTSALIWGPPAVPRLARMRRGTVAMIQFTCPVLLAFGLFGVWDAYSARQDWQDVVARLFAPHAFLTLTVYVPWAFMQQTLFQCYLLGRLRMLVPSASAVVLAAVNGVFFGAVHWPEWDVMLITVVGGLVWSYAYQRDRSLLPLALSHAVLGTAYFYWVRHRDLVRILWFVLGFQLGLA